MNQEGIASFVPGPLSNKNPTFNFFVVVRASICSCSLPAWPPLLSMLEGKAQSAFALGRVLGLLFPLNLVSSISWAWAQSREQGLCLPFALC